MYKQRILTIATALCVVFLAACGNGGDDSNECGAMTCADIDEECGEFDDGCGGTLECECDDGEECEDEQCVAECEPDTCEDLDVECGEHDNGCGGTVDCGSCDGDQEECSDGVCECVPSDCDDLGAECGTQDDGCGGTVSCGECSGDNDVCNEGTCECDALENCLGVEEDCGEIDDGCGGTVDCGECDDGETCENNLCEIDPDTCTLQGEECGVGEATCCEGATCNHQSPSDGDCRERCCVPNGGECENDNDCCGAQTQPGGCDTNALPTCNNGTCCQLSGQTCNTDEDCCGDLSCGQSGLCS